MSGHIFFADKYLAEKNYGYDDALYAAIRIINIVAKSDKKLSDLRKELPQTFFACCKLYILLPKQAS
jgi:phosphomannomutase